MTQGNATEREVFAPLFSPYRPYINLCFRHFPFQTCFTCIAVVVFLVCFVSKVEDKWITCDKHAFGEVVGARVPATPNIVRLSRYPHAYDAGVKRQSDKARGTAVFCSAILYGR